tara:strand:+ start:5882 stop:6265 length:384 start_codon:yes stop_codon:yes gene_type:complete
MTSVLNVDTIAAKNGTSPVGLLKADTIKFRVMHSGDSPTVDASLNLSSLDDIAAGKYRYNFTNNFSNGFYTPTALSTEDGSIGYVTMYYSRDYDTRVSSDLELNGIDHNNSYDDGRWTSVHSSGDLA